MEEKIYYVYSYIRSEDSENGKAGSPYYIGKGKGNRAYQKDRNAAKRPKDKDRIVIISSNMSEVDSFQLEIFLIYLYGRIDNKTGCLRNQTDGGEGRSGRKMTLEQIKALNSSRRPKGEFKWSKEQRENLSKILKSKNMVGHWKGKTFSEEARKNMSESSKGKSCPWNTKYKQALGHKVSKETKEILSKKLTGYPQSKETRKKRSESLKKFNEENRRIKGITPRKPKMTPEEREVWKKTRDFAKNLRKNKGKVND